MLLLEYILHSPNSSVALSNVQRGAETMMMSPLASSPGWASNAAPGVRQWSIKMVSNHQRKTSFFSVFDILSKDMVRFEHGCWEIWDFCLSFFVDVTLS